MRDVIIIVLGWAACGLLAHTAILAHFQRKYSCISSEVRGSDLSLSVTAGVLGPIGLLSFVLFELWVGDRPFRYGFVLWPEAPVPKKTIIPPLPARAEIVAGMRGLCYEQDRLWRIILPDGRWGFMAEYNDEITGVDPILAEEDPKHFHYGGNAYYVLGWLAQERGWHVHEVPR